jgi:hypothetical protein
MIHNYNSFIATLLDAGFSGAVGGKDDGVFGLFRYGWGAKDNSGVVWHTGDPDTDPWEWRMRVLDERDDIAYAKVFFKKAGYITQEWYPFFLAARRGGRSYHEEYSDGMLSHFSKRIYEVFDENRPLPLHEIKQLAGFKREDASKFDAALNEMQMKLYLTMCGREQKLSRTGDGYGWHSTVFCTTETFWSPEVFERAAKLKAEEAIDTLFERVLILNPATNQKKLQKFITG